MCWRKAGRTAAALDLALIATLSWFCCSTWHSSGRPAGRSAAFVASRNRGSASTRVDVIASAAGGAPLSSNMIRVEEVQRALLAAGNYRGMVDGVAGGIPARPLQLPKSAGLRVTGEISPARGTSAMQQVAAASQFTASVAALDKTPGSAALRRNQTGWPNLLAGRNHR
jgi:hypothetical protein